MGRNPEQVNEQTEKMSRQLVFGDSYENSVSDAMEWYSKRSEYAALYLMQVLNEALETIEHNPLLFQVRKRNFRYVPFNSVSVHFDI